VNDDYFTKLDEQLSALTSEGAHLDRWARWRPLDRAARRTIAALGLVMLLAALLVIEFPGSASGNVQRATAQATPGSLTSGGTAGPTAPLGRLT
jgi:hypothetical protein